MILLPILFIAFPAAYHISSETIEITVTDKERISSGPSSDRIEKYLVYTQDESFENTDSWMFFKFSSSDLQGKLMNDSTYSVKVAGWRVPFLSSYRNIVKIN